MRSDGKPAKEFLEEVVNAHLYASAMQRKGMLPDREARDLTIHE